MSRSPRYRVPFRRRREGTTDYRVRLALLKGDRPRAVIRFTKKRIRVAITAFAPAGDRVLAAAESGELRTVGFPEKGLSSTPASYLTGYLAGLRAKAKGASDAVLDAGLRRPSAGGRLLGALKGLLDSGVTIPHGEAPMPSADRLNGKHLKYPLPEPLESYRLRLPGASTGGSP